MLPIKEMLLLLGFSGYVDEEEYDQFWSQFCKKFGVNEYEAMSYMQLESKKQKGKTTETDNNENKNVLNENLKK